MKGCNPTTLSMCLAPLVKPQWLSAAFSFRRNFGGFEKLVGFECEGLLAPIVLENPQVLIGSACSEEEFWWLIGSYLKFLVLNP